MHYNTPPMFSYTEQCILGAGGSSGEEKDGYDPISGEQLYFFLLLLDFF